MNLANEALLQGRAARAELLLQSVRPKNGESDFRGFEWHKLQNDLHRNLLFDVDGHTLEVTCMSVSSDGKRWLVAGGDMNSGYYYIVDVETGNVLHDKKRLGCNVNGCAFDSVRDQFAIAQGNGRLSFFDSRTFEKCGSDETSTTLRSLSVSPDSKWMIGGGDKGEILVINLENKEKQLLPRADQSPIVYSFFAADSMSFYTAVEWGNEGKISRKWSLQSWPPTKERDYPATVLHDISPDGKTLIGTDWGMLSTISTSDGNTLRSEAISSGPIARALYLNADQILVATRSDNEIKMVDSQSLRIDQAYPMHQPVMGLALDRLHQRWGSGDSHGDLRIWSVDQPSDSKPLCMVEAKFAKFLPDGQRVMLAINDSATQVWDPATGKLSPVSNRDNLRAISADGTIQVCESTALEGKKQFDVWTQGLEQPKSVPFEADVNRRGLSLSVTGKWLSVKSEGKPTLVYDLQSRESKPIYKVKGSASGVEISPDDRFLVIAQQFGVVGYFDLQNGVALPNLKELESFWAWGLSVAFSRDGRLVASGNESGIISVWETTSRKQICRLVTGQGEIAALDFFPDGRRLAAGGNGCVLICDVETEQELIRLPTLDTQVTCVDVNDQGTAVCAITNGGHIYYWNGAAK